MKAESPDKGTIAQVYLLRPVLPHLRTRIPKVENIKMPAGNRPPRQTSNRYPAKKQG